MKKLLMFLGAGLLVAGAASAGGSFEDTPQQQAVPQTKVVIVPPTEGSGTGWLVPVAVALVGAGGIIGAAAIANKRKGS